MPGRLLVGDATAFHQSALRLIDFLQTRPVSHILGGHIELDAHGETYWFGSQYHPNERSLALSKEDLLILPNAFEHFNGFYASYPSFVLFNSIRILVAESSRGACDPDSGCVESVQVSQTSAAENACDLTGTCGAYSKANEVWLREPPNTGLGLAYCASSRISISSNTLVPEPGRVRHTKCSTLRMRRSVRRSTSQTECPPCISPDASTCTYRKTSCDPESVPTRQPRETAPPLYRPMTLEPFCMKRRRVPGPTTPWSAVELTCITTRSRFISRCSPGINRGSQVQWPYRMSAIESDKRITWRLCTRLLLKRE
jgi:hypothetical protein